MLIRANHDAKSNIQKVQHPLYNIDFPRDLNYVQNLNQPIFFT